MRPKVLVLGSDSRSTLSVVRSLGRKGIEVHLGWIEENSIVPFSKYTFCVHDLPGYSESSFDWLESLEGLLRQEQFELVIPTNDRMILPFIKQRSRLGSLAKVAIPNDDAFYAAYDKRKTMMLALNQQVPVPKQAVICQTDDLETLEIDWGFPVVIKPASSKVVNGDTITAISVSYANSLRELRDGVKRLLNVTPVIVQEFFVGGGVGLELLANKGEILCAFQHVRIHEPISGGGSTYRKSVPVNEKLLGCAARLMASLCWTGVAMLEFRENRRTGAFVLIEINGRFWGSLPLAMAAGMDFPYYLYKLLVEGQTVFPQHYKVGLYCRNVRMDLSWMRANLFAKVSKYNNALPLWRVLPEVSNFLLLHERFDTFVLDDMKPAAYEFKHMVNHLLYSFSKLGYRFWLKLPLAKFHMNKRFNKKKHPVCLCFVCKGNICRSPFAEAYLQKLLGKASRNNVVITSAGYYPVSGRTAPEKACLAAKRFDTNLEPHRSRIITEKTFEENDIVFVFDIQGYIILKKKFGPFNDKIIFLGALDKSKFIRIVADPYSKTLEEFIDCYGHIAELIDELFQKMFPVR